MLLPRALARLKIHAAKWIVYLFPEPYRRSNTTGAVLVRRREGCPEAIVQLARKAQDRLRRRFHRLLLRGKPATVVVTALARELAGFVWAMAQKFPQPA